MEHGTESVLLNSAFHEKRRPYGHAVLCLESVGFPVGPDFYSLWQQIAANIVSKLM